MWAPFPFTVDAKNQLTSSPGGSPSYDANGNLTALHDGTFDTADYDDENRLISMQVSNSWRTDFAYDGLGRLRQRSESNWGGANWLLNYSVNYIYDGWRVIQERNSTNTPTFSYTRGNDLSGSLEGAGGIGGLLARSANYSSGNWLVHHYYFADGNGNVTTILSSFPRVVAEYRYDPFGNTISCSGTLASTNVYRFSSKEIHVNSGMYYYGYRFYDPNLQRWINSDPRGEEGGINLYGFTRNDPIDSRDSYGLMPDGPTPGELGAAECNRQHIRCFRDCWRRQAPYPWGDYSTPGERKAAKYRYCEEVCLAEYMECMKRVERRCQTASAANTIGVLAVASVVAGAPATAVTVGAGIRVTGGALIP